MHHVMYFHCSVLLTPYEWGPDPNAVQESLTLSLQDVELISATNHMQVKWIGEICQSLPGAQVRLSPEAQVVGMQAE